MLALCLINTVSSVELNQEYYFYKSHKNINQTIGSYLLYLDGSIRETLPNTKTSSAMKEQLLPIEFVDRMREFKETSRIELEMGFGNKTFFDDVREIKHRFNNSGVSLKTNSHNEEEFYNVAKLFAGTFGIEIEKTITNYDKLIDLSGNAFIYHNNGEGHFNTITMNKLMRFFNLNHTFMLFQILNSQKAMDADYITVTLTVELDNDSIKVGVSFGMLFREFLSGELFLSESYRRHKLKGDFIINDSKRTVIDEGNFLSSSLFSTAIKKANSFYYFKDHARDESKMLDSIQFIEKPFTSIDNVLTTEFTNTDFNRPVTVKLFILLTHREMPILSKTSIDCLEGECGIVSKNLTKHQKRRIDTIPSHIIEYELELKIRSKIRISIPYVFIQENFESLTSNNVINYVIPASLFSYKYQDSATEHFDKFNNIAYKGKAYDTTIVFAVISVYLVILFLMFNTLIGFDKKKE